MKWTWIFEVVLASAVVSKDHQLFNFRIEEVWKRIFRMADEISSVPRPPMV
jgi:hypothetical protein